MEFKTLDTIVNDILLVIRGSSPNRAETVSKRQIEDLVHQYRAFLLRRDIDANKKPNPDYIQEIPYVELKVIPVGGTDIIDNSLDTDEYIMRSKVKIPSTIDFSNKSGIVSIITPYGKQIQLIPEQRYSYQEYKTFTSRDPMAFLHEGYLYIVNAGALQFITLRGIFEVPPEVGNFVNPVTNQPIYTMDTKYPVPIDKVGVIRDLILSKVMQTEGTIPVDEVNDEKLEKVQVKTK